jgi:hypothetical protein
MAIVKTIKPEFTGIWCLFLLICLGGILWAQTPSTEALIWQKAVALRTASYTLAPGEIPYEQYHIDRKEKEPHREFGVLSLSYDNTGKAAISVIWAKSGEKDVTAQRADRLEKQASRRNELLFYFTPFDPDVQDKLERKSGRLIFAEGKMLWEYEFRLPIDRNRNFAGKARVDNDGRPYDFSFTLSPKPFYLDIMDIHITFGAVREYLVFETIKYNYKASFLFWAWNGGGFAEFDEWKWISAPPRFN